MTGRQRELLAFLHDTVARTGICPTARETARQLKRHPTCVNRTLAILEEDGYIRRDLHKWPRYEIIASKVFPGLSYAELKWCQANPERVRAMMRLVSAAG